MVVKVRVGVRVRVSARLVALVEWLDERRPKGEGGGHHEGGVEAAQHASKEEHLAKPYLEEGGEEARAASLVSKLGEQAWRGDDGGGAMMGEGR